MTRKVRIALCAAFSIWSCYVIAKRPMNKLRKAFYYVGRAENTLGKGVSLDLGKIILLFDKKPEMTLLPDKYRSATKETLIFFFPFSLIGTREGKKTVEALNASESKYYTFHLEQMNKPRKGLQLSIVYDPSKVGWDQRRLKTIKSDKGVEIRFHDSAVLNALKKAKAPRMATAKKKRSLLTVGMGEMILGRPVIMA